MNLRIRTSSHAQHRSSARPPLRGRRPALYLGVAAAGALMVNVLTAGGPGNSSSTTPIYMYEQAFQFYDLGYGTAMALVLLLVGALFSLVYLKFVSVDER